VFKRVVVPIGRDHEGAQAIPVAASLADRAQTPVALVTVVEPVGKDGAESVLRDLIDGRPGFTGHVIETGGPPEAALLAELHGGEPSLWCVGSHARGALGEVIFGSLSEEFVRHAHAPVVLVGPHVEGPTGGDVLTLALDATARSESLLPDASDLASRLGMNLRLVQVAPERSGVFPSDISETSYLARVARRLTPGDADYEVVYARGVARGLTDYAAREPTVGMLALSSRGLKGGARMLHGSTGFDVARTAAVPVLILHSV
jgi:nucleotide-binding universal stress UspA family protein